MFIVFCRYYCLIVFVCFGTCLDIYSQYKIRFESIPEKQGLSSSSVTSICQDDVGFLWYGTHSGLNRYDGHNIKTYVSGLPGSDSISHNFVKALLVDKKGTLWVGTFGGGLNIFNREKETFVCYQNNPDDANSISNNLINDIHEDRFGNIWIATWGGGLNLVQFSEGQSSEKVKGFDGNIKFVHFRYDSLNPNGLVGDKVNSIYEDKTGNLWIATKTGVSVYDIEKKKFTNYRNDPNNTFSISNNNATSVCEDNMGNIWIGTWDGGLNKFDKLNNAFKRFTHDEKDQLSISHNRIYKLYKDYSGILWIGTWGGGLDQLVIPADQVVNNEKIGEKNHDEIFIHFQSDPLNTNSISGNIIYSIFEDRTGGLWIGTANNGFSKFDKRKTHFSYINAEPYKTNSLNDKIVSSIYIDNLGIMWLGTNLGGLNIYNKEKDIYTHYLHDPNDPNSISNNSIKTIYQDKSGTIWIGTETGFNKYDPVNRHFIQYYYDNKKKSDTHVRSICEDRYGYLWLGNFGSGLVRFDRNRNKFESYFHDPNDQFSIADNYVATILEDQQGALWIGTANGGLNKYDRQNDRFIKYINEPGNNKSISSNVVNMLFEDSDGDIWAATSNGLNLIIKDKGPDISFYKYSTKDGFTSNAISGILEDKHGNLWISSTNGIIKFNKKTKKIKNYNASNGLQGTEFRTNSSYYDKNTNIMYFGGFNGLSYFNPDSIKENLVVPSVAIVDLKILNKSVHINDTVNGQVILNQSIVGTKEITLSHKNNFLSFYFAALQYNSPEYNQFAYMMEGFDKEWNYVGNKSEATYTNLNAGNYTFHVKAANNDGVWNEKGTSIDIIILPPWWQTIWFRLLVLIVIIGSLVVFYLSRVKILKNQKILLEKQVSERTKEINEKNKILLEQTNSLNESNVLLEEKSQYIEEQNELLVEQKEKLEEHHKLIEKQKEELQTSADELIQKNNTLTTLNATKDKFFTIIAHDLKNPFNSILGFSEVMLMKYDKHDDEKRKMLLSNIFSSAKKVYELLENLLHWARSQTGVLDINPEVFELQEIIRSNIFLVDNLLKEKKLQIVTQGVESLKVFADKNMVTTIIRNLVTNAIKFSENGTISIDGEQKGPIVIVQVHDNGIGIDPLRLKNIFDVVGAKSSSGTKGEQGSGLGLILCKEFIEKNNGTIGVESEVGKGSTFYFTLPAHA